ncbi:hypothetical protein ACMFMG_005264 [Clarireedia jacksonii]
MSFDTPKGSIESYPASYSGLENGISSNKHNYLTNGVNAKTPTPLILAPKSLSIQPLPPHLQPPPSMHFSPNATYLITGGYGGLGRSISIYLGEHGAHNLLFLSPNAGLTPQSQALLAELSSMGCRATSIRGHAQNPSDIQRVIFAAPAPIKGVIHLAMQLRDASILDMTYVQWVEVLAPKVDGAWNLHCGAWKRDIRFLRANKLAEHGVLPAWPEQLQRGEYIHGSVLPISTYTRVARFGVRCSTD